MSKPESLHYDTVEWCAQKRRKGADGGVGARVCASPGAVNKQVLKNTQIDRMTSKNKRPIIRLMSRRDMQTTIRRKGHTQRHEQSSRRMVVTSRNDRESSERPAAVGRKHEETGGKQHRSADERTLKILRHQLSERQSTTSSYYQTLEAVKTEQSEQTNDK